MFGFMHGSRSDKRYRQIYAMCCSSLRDEMGLRSLSFVSYEAIFAHSMAVDLGMVPAPQSNGVTCCRARRRHSGLLSSDSPGLAASARFSNSLAMLLANVKLNDDVMDSRSTLAKLGRRLLRAPIRASNDFFSVHDSNFQVKMRQLLDDHAGLEQLGRDVGLDRYTRPTGDAFALVFGILPQVIARGNGERVDQDQVEYFRRAGQLVGQALIAFDCAVDFRSDRKRGHHNPLGSPGAVGIAFEFSQRKLIELGWHLSDVAARDSERRAIAPGILRHRLATLGIRKRQVANQAPFPIQTPPTTQALRLKRRARLPGVRLMFLSPVRPRRGFCDCDCPCDGCVGGCEGGGAADCCSGGCHCPCDCCCDSMCGNVCSKTPSSASGNSAGLASGDHVDSPVAQTAQVVVALTPYGTVRLEELPEGASESAQTREEPAKSNGGMIEVGETVVVIRKEAFGLLVRRKANISGQPSERLPEE